MSGAWHIIVYAAAHGRLLAGYMSINMANSWVSCATSSDGLATKNPIPLLDPMTDSMRADVLLQFHCALLIG